jgi:Transposase, Mutator family
VRAQLLGLVDQRDQQVARRGAGVIVSQAVLVAVAVDEDGRRQILAVELANRESRSSWRDFLSGLRARGLAGVEFVVSDNHEGLKAALREVLSEAAWQRCYVHFLRNALDYVPRKVDDDCLHKKRPCGPWPPDGGRARTALRYTGAPRRPRPTSPTPANLLNLTHTTGVKKIRQSFSDDSFELQSGR